MSATPLQICIAAHSAEPQPDNQGNQGPSRWRVTVSAGKPATTSTRDLEDPFDDKKRSECQWYLEQFVSKAPYSLGPARKAEESLQTYAPSLLRDLGLVELVNKELSSKSTSKRAVTISVREDGTSGSSIHQLHWELLEDPAPWGMDIEVTVKRMVHAGADRANAGIQTRSLDGSAVSTPARVNGLLVVARDLSRNSAAYDDVSPHLALGILARFQEDLGKRKLPMYLNLEVVRPGSLNALEKQLKQASERHGNGYYHFVHFDLHGTVRSKPPPGWFSGNADPDDKTPTGYLLFNDPDPDALKTKGENAQRVAKVLGKYGVPIAILNACESARANSGDAANIAKAFTKNGVQNVLAMSFKVSSSAAELFLRAFYHALFLEGLTFSQAARRGREVLRRHPVRKARLELRRPLLDSFVPAVYSAGQDLKFTTTGGEKMSRDFDTSEFALDAAKPRGKPDQQLTGRDFDLLRLEKHLLVGRTVYLSGRPGVGKTALLRYASAIWTQTSFVDFVVFIDFSKVCNAADAVSLLVSQLPVKEEEVRKILRSKFQEMIKSPNLNLTRFAAEFWKVCSRLRLIIILDGLHTICLQQLHDQGNRLCEEAGKQNGRFKEISPDLIRPGPFKEISPDLIRLIEGLLNLRDTKNAQNTVYTILVGRSDGTTLPFEEEMQKEITQTHFRLRDLRLSDSIELSQRAIRDVGVNVDDWKDDEVKELGLLVGLLDGNPSAILHVAPQISKAGNSVRELRSIIQHGISLGGFAGHGKDMFEELDSMFRAMNDEQGAFLLLLSAFWNEAMPVMSLVNWATSENICKNPINGLVLAYANALGLTETDSSVQEHGEEEVDPVITWVHPLLTLYGRKAAYEVLHKKQVRLLQQKGPGTSQIQQFLSSLFGGRSSSKKSQSVAAVLVMTVLRAELNMEALPEETRALSKKFETTFLGWVAEVSLKRWVSNRVEGLSYEKIHSSWASEAANLATCLSICTRQPYLPIEKWPLGYLSGRMVIIRIAGTPAQATEFAAYYEQLLEVFIELNGGEAIPVDYQESVFLIVTYLTAIYTSEVPHPAKRKQYVDKALEIIKKTEDVGNLGNSPVMYLKGLALRHQALYLLQNGDGEKAVQVWKDMVEFENLIFKDPQNPVSSDPMLKAYHKARKQTGKLLGTIAAGKHKGMDSDQLGKLFGGVGDGMKQISKGAARTGFNGVEDDLRWWPEDFDLLAFYNKLANPDDKLAALENATASGNTAEVSEHLNALWLGAFFNYEFEEVEEYLNAVEKLPRSGSSPELQDIDAGKIREMLGAYNTIVGAIGGTSTSGSGSKSDFDAVAESAQKQINLLKESNAPREAIEAAEVAREIWLKDPNVLENRDPGAPFQHRKLMQTVGSYWKSGAFDREFVENLSRSHLQFQRLMQELQDAELKEDFSLALKRLKTLTNFLEEPRNEILKKGFEDGSLDKKQTEYEFSQAGEAVREELQMALSNRDIDGARRLIQKFENGLSPQGRELGKENIARLKKLTDETAEFRQALGL